MIKIPNPDSKKIVQSNRSNILGDIWSSFNLDLSSNIGVFKVSPRFMTIATSENNTPPNDTDLMVPFAFVKHPQTGNWYCGTGGGGFVFKGTTVPNGTFAQDTATGSPSFGANRPDMAVFNSRIYAANTTLSKLDADETDWDDVAGVTTCNGSLVPFLNRLYFVIDTANFDDIVSINTSDTVATLGQAYTVSISGFDCYSITCMKATSTHIWIAAHDPNEGVKYSRMYRWDGIATTISANDQFLVPAAAILSIVIKENVPWIIDSEGILRSFNGGSFEEIDRLPVKNGKYLKSPIGGGTVRAVHPNGMIVDGDDILMLVAGQYKDTNGTQEENIQSGIWKYNSKNGLHHYASLSYWKDQVTTTATDFGQIRLSEVGALAICRNTDTTSTTNGIYLAGGEFYNTAGTIKRAIWINDSKNTTQKYGFFITSWISSKNIKDTWQKLVTKYRELLNSSDRIVLKYRTREDVMTESTITWTSSDSISSTADLSAYSVGDQVEVIQGIGSGKCSHITSITLTGGTYFINLDETYTGATGTSKARFQKWIKIGTVSDQTTESKISVIGKSSERVQIKCTMLFTGDDEVHEVVIVNNEHEKYE